VSETQTDTCRGPDGHGTCTLPRFHEGECRPSDEMTIDQFTADVLDQLHDFRTFWRNGREDAPDLYPATMPPGDWWEQFMEHDRDV
jgi:hypothetical protein